MAEVRAAVRASAFTLLLAIAFGCGGGSSPPGATASGTPLSMAEASKPSVEITYPEEGSDPVAAGDVLVALTVRSFSVVDKAGKKPNDGEGHLVYYLDVEKIPTGSSSAVKDGGQAAISVQTSHTWKHVKPGRHRLGVQLVNNDDTPLDPPATDEIQVLVTKS